MRTLFLWRGFIGLGVCLLPELLTAQDWWLEGGPVFRGGMKVDVRGSTYVQQGGLHDPAASGPLAPPTGIGALNSYADRTYDNGYVKIDPGTGNPASLDPNTTWYWGYDNASQYNPNPGAQTLSYQKQGAPGYTTLANRPTSGSTEMLGAGLQLVAGLPMKKSGRLTLSATFGFQGIWANPASLRDTPYREDVRQTTVTDVYNVSAISPGSFPGPGFKGTYWGPFGSPPGVLPVVKPVIPSPVIPNQPTSRTSATSAPLSTDQDTAAFQVNESLYQLSLGPRIDWRAASWVKLNLRPTMSLNIVDVDVQRTEMFQNNSGAVLNHWSDHSGNRDVLLGLGVTGGVDFELGRGFFVGLFGGYEWVPADVQVAVGPSTVSLNPSGYTAGAMLGLRF